MEGGKTVGEGEEGSGVMVVPSVACNPMSKTQDEKKVYAHIKCFKCEDMGHFSSKCPTKLEKKT